MLKILTWVYLCFSIIHFGVALEWASQSEWLFFAMSIFIMIMFLSLFFHGRNLQVKQEKFRQELEDMKKDLLEKHIYPVRN